jgi:hypothetical protein
VLGRLALVLGTVLLEAVVLRGLVLLAALLAALGALDVWVGSVRAAKAVLGRDTLVGGAVLLEAVVLIVSTVAQWDGQRLVGMVGSGRGDDGLLADASGYGVEQARMDGRESRGG